MPRKLRPFRLRFTQMQDINSFLQKQSHQGPRCEKSRRLFAWRTGKKEAQRSTIDSGSLARSITTRSSSVKDKPIGMPQVSRETLWIDFIAMKGSWRIYFTLRHFDSLFHGWTELRNQLIQQVSKALRHILGSHAVDQADHDSVRQVRQPTPTVTVKALKLHCGSDPDPQEKERTTLF